MKNKPTDRQGKLDRLTDMDVAKAEHSARMLTKGIYTVEMFNQKLRNYNNIHRKELSNILSEDNK